MANISIENDCVKTHLNMLNSIINRMADNSTKIKAWTITIISAILVLLIQNKIHKYIWISLIPLFAFFILDSYYLSLEKQFRSEYRDFVHLLHKGKLKPEEIYVFSKCKFIDSVKNFAKAILSPSIWLFYTIFFIIIFLIVNFVI